MTEDKRIANVLREQISELEASIKLWETGKLKMHCDGVDISDQQIADMRRQIAGFELALEFVGQS